MKVLELGRFAAVGLIQNGVNLAVFALVSAEGGYIAAACLGSASGLAVSYLLNRSWTFRATSRGAVHHEAARYTLTFVSAVLLGVAILTLLVEVFGLPEVASQAIAIGLVAPISYMVQRTWVFRAGAEGGRCVVD